MTVRITPLSLILVAGGYVLGVIFAVPVVVKMAIGFLRHPRTFWARRNYSALDLPAPAPDVHHVMTDTAPGVSIHTVRTFSGLPTKPLLLLIHGFPEYWGSWRHQIAAFRGDHDIVAISPRGYCLSSRPTGVAAYSVDKLASDVIAVIESLGAPLAALVGHDWGAHLAWYVAALRPDLMDKLIVACAPHPACFLPNLYRSPTQLVRRSQYLFVFSCVGWLAEADLQREDFKRLEEIMWGPATGLGHREAVSAEQMDCYKRELARPGARAALINFYRAAFRQTAGLTPLPQEWREAMQRPISVPTLLIWGENDGAAGTELLRGTDRCVTDLRIEIISDCSHWVQQDRPEEFNRLMREFLEGSVSCVCVSV